jgi:polar amino acid transport system substrate-binding protein
MLCRKGGKLSNSIADFLVWLIQGMPVVVLLMILYYVVFAKSSIDGAVVSVIAFTLVFGVAVFGMLKMGVGAVDNGQKEAAYALGFSDMRTFFRIILPQAIPHFLPSYKAEVISLIKATAVVGYIAVQDLTKMGDIVRGRTYEAFFPLIAVAILYFILGGILTTVISRIEIDINPKKRREADILKGINTND